MRILLFGKYPPIQGGTSSQVLNTVRLLAAAGHEVDVVTNGREAEPSCRSIFTAIDEDQLEALQRVDGPGGVEVHHTTPLGSTAYMPWAQPYSSKLFGIGVELIRSNHYDLVVGWYLEPYGLVAGHVAEIAGAPLLLRHAGSDVTRLARHADLRPAYSWLFGRADVVVTGPRSRATLLDLGARPQTLRMAGPGRLPDYFSTPAAPLDLADLHPAALAAFDAMTLSPSVRSMLAANLQRAPEGPVIGVCGKVALSKGSHDLVASLERVAAREVSFTLLCAVGGQQDLLSPFLETVAATRHLRRRSIILPLLAPWRMPGFFDTCDAVCLLERSFDVALHRTRVPEEVMRRGRALILSSEISHKVHFRRRLEDRVNYLAVDDPEETDDLASVLEEAIDHPHLRDTVARGGQVLAATLADRRPTDGPTDAVLDVLVGDRRQPLSGPADQL